MDTINQLLGLSAVHLNTLQMAARAVLIFFTALVYIRVAGVKALGTSNAFNRLTILIMGAIMGRAIVAAEQPLFPSLTATLVIMLLHRLLAWVTFKSSALGKIFKGEPIPLIENGKPNHENLNKTYTTRQDLDEAAHTFINTENISGIKDAYLERSGEISLIKKVE